jgi:competence protein ComEC
MCLRGSLEEIDVLKVAHHGSKSSTSDSFLKAIHPKLSLISAGVNNRYHHPSKEVCNRLTDYGSRWAVTKETGEIKVTWEGGVISCQTWLSDA